MILNVSPPNAKAVTQKYQNIAYFVHSSILGGHELWSDICASHDFISHSSPYTSDNSYEKTIS